MHYIHVNVYVDTCVHLLVSKNYKRTIDDLDVLILAIHEIVYVFDCTVQGMLRELCQVVLFTIVSR